MKDLRISGAAERLHEGFRLHAGLHLVGHGGLLRDRFFEYAPNRAWDLVTGEPMSPGSEGDEDRVGAPAPGPLTELLDHGVDGSPRWIVMAATAAEWQTHSRTVAVEARAGATCRWRWKSFFARG